MSDAASQPPPLERVPSGIPGLDAVLRGGFLQGGTYLITGPPGSGKTILGNQICFHHVASGGRAVYLTLLAEAHARMLAHLRSFAFFDPAPISDTLYYISGYNALEQGGVDGLLDLVRREIWDRRATLLVLEGLETAAAVAESELAYKRFLYELHVFAESIGCMLFLLTQPERRSGQAEQVLVDGMIELSDELVGLRAVRELRVRKFRGSTYLRGRHAFEITDAGIIIYPRTEALLGRPTEAATEDRARLGFGIPRLDEMLGGGLSPGTATMLIGSAGSGKTVLGLHFLAAGAREGQSGLYFGFYEAPPRLIMKADQLGLDLSSHVRQGLIEIAWQPPLEHLLDALAERLLEAVQRRQVRRLFIDGLDAFQETAEHPERVGRFFTALTHELRALGVTTVFKVETARLFSPEIEVPVREVSALADNIILLRTVELQSQLYRLISIMKVRDSTHDATIREFKITDRGIDVAASFESAEAILTGTARPVAEPPARAPTRAPARSQSSGRRGRQS